VAEATRSAKGDREFLKEDRESPRAYSEKMSSVPSMSPVVALVPVGFTRCFGPPPTLSQVGVFYLLYNLATALEQAAATRD
jgi:hypothetical protein